MANNVFKVLKEKRADMSEIVLKDIKKQSRNILFSDWTSHILVFVILLVICTGITTIGSSLTYLALEISGNYIFGNALFLFYLVLSVSFVLPLLYGCLVFEIKASEGQKPKIYEMFCAFSSSDELVYSYKIMLLFLANIILKFSPAIALGVFINSPWYSSDFLNYYIGIPGIDVSYLVFNILLVALVFLGLVWSSKNFVGLVCDISYEGNTFDNFSYAKVKCVKYGYKLTSLCISFLPLFVISLFSAGILFVLYTLPYFLLSMCILSKEILQDKIS